MSKYQLRNFSLFLMRKQPVSVSVSRVFFGHECGFAKIGMPRPILWHIQLKLWSFFAEHKPNLHQLATLFDPNDKQMAGMVRWNDFLQVLEKVECHQETAKKYCQSHAGRLDWVGRSSLTQSWRLRGWWGIGVLVATLRLGSVCFAGAAVLTETKIPTS